MGVVVLKGLIPTNVNQGPLPDIKVFSLTPSHHHERKETKIIVKCRVSSQDKVHAYWELDFHH